MTWIKSSQPSRPVPNSQATPRITFVGPIRAAGESDQGDIVLPATDVMRAGKCGRRLFTANAILDRAYGRLTQSVEMSGSRDSTSQFETLLRKSMMV